MIRICAFDKLSPGEIFTRDNRAEPSVSAAVEAILAGVKQNGDAALMRYARELDHASLKSLAVSEEEIETAFAACEPEFLNTLRLAAENIRTFHAQQLHKDLILTPRPGVVLGQRYTPLERVGVYVPGGTASYPSTVLMDVIPAKLAGVDEIIMATPPRADGSIAPAILAAARIAGVSRIFKMGGAQAVAALAFGTQSVPRVDKIVGPGNIYVAEAKRRVYGLVDIDMIAGPSEILVLADGGANPAWVAADLLSQAEHDKLASAVLVTDSPALAKAVDKELERQLPLLPRAEIARASIEQNGRIVVTDNLEKALEAANLIAPEHLELCVEDPFRLLGRVRNAGSIFLGRYAPEALGDYFAGPNHTLPTSGTARFSSPLSVDDFLKKSSFTYYTAEALEKEGRRVADFARQEGLEAHARSVEARLQSTGPAGPCTPAEEAKP